MTDEATLQPFQLRPIGSSEVRVTSLGLGGGALGGMYSAVEETEAQDAAAASYEAGVRYFDTAPLYGHGRSEARLGAALSPLDRATFALSTKIGVVIEPVGAGDWATEERYADPFLLDGRFDFSYDACLASLEQSMKRVGTDRFEIVYIHDPDEGESALPPAERTGISRLPEVMDGAYRALSELREQGVVGAIGVGLNGTSLLVDFARAGDFDCFLLAGRYTLLEQAPLYDLLPVCVERRISIVIGGVFNSGILATGTRVADPKHNYRSADEEALRTVRAMEAVCARHGVSLAAAALQFPLAHPAVSCVIPGARSRAEAVENAARISDEIPVAFWEELRSEGLLDAEAPVPGGDPAVELSE